MYRHDRQQGAVAVIVAIVATLLIACMAFAIDLGYAWQVRRSMVKATDAAALAAAQTQSALDTKTATDCSTSVRNTASAFLGSNASNTTMEFCVVTPGTDTGGAGATQGTVTVRASTAAQFSFAKLFGLNSTTVHSSTTAAWSQAPILPFMACVDTNAQPSQWFKDSSSNRAPIQVAQQWSGSASSAPCSSGNSGSYGMIDLATVPSSSKNADSCKTQASTLPTSLAGWLTSGYPSTISVNDYRCARVGQPYGAAVDEAICSVRGKQAIVPLVDVVDTAEISGQGKAALVQIEGFATVTVDDYTPLDGSNQCDRQFASALGGAPTARIEARPVVARHRAATRSPRRVIRPAAPAKANPSLTMQLNGTSPSVSVTAGTLVNGSINVANSGDASWSGTATLTFGAPIPATVSFTGTATSKCTFTSPTITCSGLTVGAAGSLALQYGATWTATGSGRVTGSIGNSAAEKDYVDYTVGASPTTTTTTTPIRSVVVTIAGAGSGTVTAKATGQADQTCSTGTCTWTYPQYTSVTLTEAPGAGSLFTGWSGDGSCAGSATTCTVTIPVIRSLAVTATFGIAPTTTTTTTPPATYRILTMTFEDSSNKGACCDGLDHLYSYRICAVDLATRTEALNPPNCLPTGSSDHDCDGDDDNSKCDDEDGDERSAGVGGFLRPNAPDAALERTRLIAVHRPVRMKPRATIQHSPTTGRNPT